MWIYTTRAFLSIVAHRDEPGHLLVRGRLPGDIEEVFPAAAVEETTASDYRYRATVHTEDVARALQAEARAISYDNFKNAVEDPRRRSTYLRVWMVMHNAQLEAHFDYPHRWWLDELADDEEDLDLGTGDLEDYERTGLDDAYDEAERPTDGITLALHEAREQIRNLREAAYPILKALEEREDRWPFARGSDPEFPGELPDDLPLDNGYGRQRVCVHHARALRIAYLTAGRILEQAPRPEPAETDDDPRDEEEA